jgi:hypothetical protein
MQFSFLFLLLYANLFCGDALTPILPQIKCAVQQSSFSLTITSPQKTVSPPALEERIANLPLRPPRIVTETQK